jgi:hypothetical protein
MAKDRGKITELCPGHDYSDPGYPASECTFCKFDREELEIKNAKAVVEAAKDWLASNEVTSQRKLTVLSCAVNQFFCDGGEI